VHVQFRAHEAHLEYPAAGNHKSKDWKTKYFNVYLIYISILLTLLVLLETNLRTISTYYIINTYVDMKYIAYYEFPE